MHSNMTRVLGFDFGMKKIGVAVGQVITKQASPLVVLNAKNGEPNWPDIQNIIRKWSPQALIVGIPFNMDGTTQPMTEFARAFATQLRERFDLPVHEVDERLSTRTVRSAVFEEKGFRGLKNKRLDALAAQLIVEDWLRECD